jgi:DNA-binding CsgD family transcriptional regulator
VDEIVGRDAELDAIESWLEDARPSALLIEGDAGIGKTTLWRAGLDAARQRGRRVLEASPAGSEAQLSFTALRDLLEGAFDEIADELPSPQRRALAVVLLREEPSGAPPEQGAISVAFLTALRALAGRAPVVLALDDIQWLDRASAAPLQYALRRLDTEPVSALLALRPGEEGADPLELSRLGENRVEVVRLAPLTVGALGRMLHDRLGKGFPRPTLHRLHQVSSGNPFFALELAQALEESGIPLRPGDALPVPSTLRELVRDRLASLPPTTIEALVLASALARPSLQLLDAALGSDSRPALEPAAAAEIAALEDGDIRFAHPAFAAAVYALSAADRHALHARLAAVVEDAEERSYHLALASQAADEGVAQVVEEGARLAFTRGSPAAAAVLAAHARRLTPPADADATNRRALAEVDYQFAAGDTVRAGTLLDELLATAGSGTTRARLLSRRARLRHFGDDIGSSVSLLEQALAEAGDETGLRGEIEEGLAWGLLLLRRDLPAAVAHARSAAQLAEAREDTPALGEALAAQAVTEFVVGADWAETMDRALSLEDTMLDLRVLRHPSFAYGYCLSCSDELDRARELFLELRGRAEQAGDESSEPSLLNHLTLVECLAGRWTEAIRYAGEGFERAVESGQQPTKVSILAKSALVAARRGDAETARETASRSLALAGVETFDAARPLDAMARGGETAIWTLGFLELSLGNADECVRLLGPMVEALLAAGVREPGEVRCLPDEIEALVELGRLDDAEALLGRLEEWGDRLGRPSVRGSAGRCRGLLLGARGDLNRAIASLDEAVQEHENVPMPFELGRTVLALGSALRRARRRREARETLERALAVFEELGAAAFVTRTRTEISRIGGRAPSPSGLTPTEEQVAALVAEGKSNKEVAAQLIVSVHTVEAALTSVYRKLDLRSRTELARELAVRSREQ